MRIRDWSSDGCSSDLLGAKTSWFDGALGVDMTGFYIDGKNIPLQVQDRLGLFKYLDNVGDARIYGVETSLAVRPAHFVTLRSAITWNKATLQNFYDPQNGRPPVEPGDPLPGAPKWTSKIGRASGRERGCQYGLISGVAGNIKKKKTTKT